MAPDNQPRKEGRTASTGGKAGRPSGQRTGALRSALRVQRVPHPPGLRPPSQRPSPPAQQAASHLPGCLPCAVPAASSPSVTAAPWRRGWSGGKQVSQEPREDLGSGFPDLNACLWVAGPPWGIGRADERACVERWLWVSCHSAARSPSRPQSSYHVIIINWFKILIVTSGRSGTEHVPHPQ